MSISKTLAKEWYVLLLLAAMFAASAVLWDRLPDTVPTHFNIHGEADDWGPKWINAWMLPGIGLGIYILLLVLPVIDPKKKIAAAQKPIAGIRIISTVFLAGIYGFVMAASLGYAAEISTYMFIAVGILFIFMGNYINSVKPNYFIGIRTPWTLESEVVWKKTHRLASKLWIACGLVMMAGSFFASALSNGFIIAFMIIFGAVIPLVYSYIEFRKQEINNEEI